MEVRRVKKESLRSEFFPVRPDSPRDIIINVIDHFAEYDGPDVDAGTKYALPRRVGQRSGWLSISAWNIINMAVSGVASNDIISALWAIRRCQVLQVTFQRSCLAGVSGYRSLIFSCCLWARYRLLDAVEVAGCSKEDCTV